jgi:hypothetical protein
MIIGPSIPLIWETIDLVRMRGQAAGRIDAVSIERGGHGTSRANIEYHFTPNGRLVHSTRYLPGFEATCSNGWTGGARVARDFPVGRQVTVYVIPMQPERCALEYGWFFISVGMTMIFVGGALQAASVTVCPGPWASCLKYAGQACLVYGFGLMFLGPRVVRIVELPWHALAWAGALVIVLLNAWYSRRRRVEEGCRPPTHSAIVVCGSVF